MRAYIGSINDKFPFVYTSDFLFDKTLTTISVCWNQMRDEFHSSKVVHDSKKVHNGNVSISLLDVW